MRRPSRPSGAAPLAPRALTGLLALAGALLGGCATPLPPRPPASRPPPLALVRLDAPDRPWVALRVQFLAGSADDPPGREGLTALCARVMAEGGTRTLSSSELPAKLFPWAAELSVQVGAEQTTFVGRAPAAQAAAFVPLFTEVVREPRWDPRELERLRRSAIDSLTRGLRASDDEALGKAALHALIYRGHPYGHPVAGTVEGLQAISTEDCRAHAARVFGRARLRVAIGGRTDDGLVEALRDGLAALPEGSARGAPVAAPAPAATQVLVIQRAEAPATAISLGLPIEVRRDHPDFFALWLATSVLGEHRQQGGRLFEGLRAARGLNYGTYAYLEHFEQDGWSTLPLPNVARSRQLFSIWVRPVEPGRALFALRASLRELDRFARDGITAEELARTRDFLRGYTRLFDQTDSRRLGYALDDAFYGAPSHLPRFREALERLTLDEVNAAIRRHVRPTEVRIAVVAPDGAAFAAGLRSGAPTPIRYAAPPPAAVLAEDREIERFPFGFAPAQVEVSEASALFQR